MRRIPPVLPGELPCHADDIIQRVAVAVHVEQRTKAAYRAAAGGCRLLTISRADLEIVLDLDPELAGKVLRAMVRLLSVRLRATNDNLRSILAMSMF